MRTPPKSYLFVIVLVGAFLLFLTLSYVSIIESQNIFWTMQEYIARWSFIIVFAILGGILFGMLLAYRLFSATQFTPFEKAMLEMRGEIRTIKESFDQYQSNEIIGKMRSMEQQLTSLARELENSGMIKRNTDEKAGSREIREPSSDPANGKSFSASKQEGLNEREEP